MDRLLLFLAPLVVGSIVAWLWRRRRIGNGLECWNCGADLNLGPLYVGSKERSRCPKCGNEMDVSDVYKLLG